MNPIKVLVVDDHDLFRRGLMEVLEEEDDVTVIGEARNGHEAIKRVEEMSPDVIFMDLNMPGQNGIEATAYLTQKWPELKVLVLTVSEEAADLYRALSVLLISRVAPAIAVLSFMIPIPWPRTPEIANPRPSSRTLNLISSGEHSSSTQTLVE